MLRVTLSLIMQVQTPTQPRRRAKQRHCIAQHLLATSKSAKPCTTQVYVLWRDVRCRCKVSSAAWLNHSSKSGVHLSNSWCQYRLDSVVKFVPSHDPYTVKPQGNCVQHRSGRRVCCTRQRWRNTSAQSGGTGVSIQIMPVLSSCTCLPADAAGWPLAYACPALQSAHMRSSSITSCPLRSAGPRVCCDAVAQVLPSSSAPARPTWCNTCHGSTAQLCKLVLIKHCYRWVNSSTITNPQQVQTAKDANHLACSGSRACAGHLQHSTFACAFRRSWAVVRIRFCYA